MEYRADPARLGLGDIIEFVDNGKTLFGENHDNGLFYIIRSHDRIDESGAVKNPYMDCDRQYILIPVEHLDPLTRKDLSRQLVYKTSKLAPDTFRKMNQANSKSCTFPSTYQVNVVKKATPSFLKKARLT